jgi:hypothetical protein
MDKQLQEFITIAAGLIILLHSVGTAVGDVKRLFSK